ncbi:hypothetical protein FRX31_035065 [Thalictrum thalictroides]|uniref:Uncharacterized protein n=1 Tax=Thalictrum thalictroides TaxID=46969 RepID=A0A7J6US26_THATH|nr:hypothetical protein FRX31_035065 [Thalictrum thalictroides]
MGPIINYLLGVYPDDDVELQKLERKSKSYELINNRLYRKSVGGPHLRCLPPPQAQTILAEIHQGEC